MNFTLQEPGTDKLLKEINSAALNAESGGGVFAFASKGGIDTFFSLPNIISMLSTRRPFHLVIGIDAITNVETLLCLTEKVEEFHGTLTAHVFLHNSPVSTFHPKFSWFVQSDSIKILNGSGNLTLRGLGQTDTADLPSGNWEAFSKQIFKSKFVAVKNMIDGWLQREFELGRLCSLNDSHVLEKAMFNGRMRFTRPPVSSTQRVNRSTSSAVMTPVDGIEFETPEILIRELPKTRPGQADVGEAALKEFFGYIEGERKKVLIQNVSEANELGPVLEIYLFVNASRNFRLELHTITELGYDIAQDDSRMILIATKLDRRSFRYTIIPITSKSYIKIATLLGSIPTSARRRMREVRVSADQLQLAWPSVPTNLLPIRLDTPEF
ncbi:hypothetical protein [Trichlorobacter lovleyi]|uniref:hypothetical protein n=1 Tax=Trichlorobacter lovleyi TaxID=313985 RepID=UPI00247FE43E|nr:hypothetical protein [Trichlorobacter lovleyi]